jgi:hypothetical protein
MARDHRPRKAVQQVVEAVELATHNAAATSQLNYVLDRPIPWE